MLQASHNDPLLKHFYNLLIYIISSVFAFIFEHSLLLMLLWYIISINRHVGEYLTNTIKQVRKYILVNKVTQQYLRGTCCFLLQTWTLRQNIPSKRLFLYTMLSDVSLEVNMLISMELLGRAFWRLPWCQTLVRSESFIQAVFLRIFELLQV